MRRFRDLSIRFKLTASLVTVASIVLLLSTVAGLVESHQSAKAAMVAQISALADVLGDASSTALQFNDEITANEVLASVRKEPTVVFAQTFDAEGNRFAVYAAPEAVPAPSPLAPTDQQSMFLGGFLHVSKPIGDPAAPIGFIYLRASMQELYASLNRRIIMTSISLILCLGVAVLLGFLVHRVISRPILQLAAATERVARNADYSARVEKIADDELGVLCDGFNTMLNQIEQRDHELDMHRTKLESLVQERTHTLESRTEQLTISNEKLLRSNQELDDFAYIVSHDLKEPLRGISRYSAFLAEDYSDQLDEAGHEKLETLQRLCMRQENLIESLLHYSRVGRAELAIRETDLNKVIEEVLEMMQVMLKEQNVEVRVPRPMPTVLCDSVRIVEVFRNLITNAVKYNDKPDKWIEVGYRTDDQIESDNTANEFSDDNQRDNYIFYVRDNGIGIREKHHESVFRIFKRLHGRDKFGGGTGAGLTFVKKILERHGGTIWLESAHGEGSTFFFTLHRRTANDVEPQDVEEPAN